MFVILAVATDTRAVGEAAAIAIGGTVALDAMFGGPISGASMNPTRSSGPRSSPVTCTQSGSTSLAPLIGSGDRRPRLPVRARRGPELTEYVENPDQAAVLLRMCPPLPSVIVHLRSTISEPRRGDELLRVREGERHGSGGRRLRSLRCRSLPRSLVEASEYRVGGTLWAARMTCRAVKPLRGVPAGIAAAPATRAPRRVTALIE